MATLTNVISNATGNVGIGTTSTDAKLQVYSTTGTTQIFNQLQLTNMGVGNNGDIVGIGFAAGESTQYGVKGSIGFVRTTSYGRGDITFYTNNTAANESVSTSNERMRITSGGSVLIGVNGAYNSSRLLQVKDGLLIGNSFYTFASIDTSGTADLILTSNANPANLGSNSNIIFKLGTSAGGGPDEKMRIVSNGNVGIGTSNPSSSLHVYGTTPTIKVQGSSTASAKVELIGTYTTWSLENQYINGANNDMFRIYNSALSADAITINRATNNVGIGATNPTAKLHIQSGSILVKGAATPGLNLEPSGVVGNADISFDGTSFILVSNSNSSDLRLSTSSTPRLTILNNGNVGIGTTSPSAKLDVSGSAIRSFITAGSTEPGFIVDYPSSNGYGAFFVHVNNTRRWRIGSVGDTNVQPALNFWQEGTGSRMIINNVGNVGIGTSSPSGNLDVVSSDSTTTYIRGASSALRFLAYADGTNWIQSGTSTSNSSADLIFSSMNGSSQWMRIQGSSGNVGIGTTSPSGKLTINNNSDQLRLETSSGPTSYYSVISAMYDSSHPFGIYVANNSVGTSEFMGVYADGGGFNNRVSFPTGNVGIGTTSPAAKLDVAGNSKLGSSISNVHQITGSLSITGSVSGINTESFHPFLLG